MAGRRSSLFPMPQRLGRLLALIFLAIPLMASQAASRNDAWITVGGEWAVVQYRVSMFMTGTLHTLVLDGFPVEADADSLMVHDPRGLVSIDSVSVVHPGPSALETNEGGWVKVSPQIAGESLDPAGRVVTCRLRTARPGRRTFSIIHRVSGIRWSAEYHVSIAGRLGDPAGRVSASADGWITIHNESGLALDHARISVVGPDFVLQQKPADPAGILDLDPFHPLTRPWRDHSKPEEMERYYFLDCAASLRPYEDVRVGLFSVSRKAIEEVYAIVDEEISTSMIGPGAPVTHYVVLKNDEALGSGRALPPGRVHVYGGDQSGKSPHVASIGHTPFRGDFRVNMGRVDRIRVKRERLDSVRSAAGFSEERYFLHIRNDLAIPAAVEITEKPLFPFSWSVTRASTRYHLEYNRIVFRPVVEPETDRSIAYTLRVKWPDQ